MTRKFKSDIERDTARILTDCNVTWEYESANCKFDYVSTYTGDFWLPGYNILLECKGYHKNLGAALSKLNKVTAQNPELDLQMVWSNDNMKVPFSKNKKRMTAWEWSDKNDFFYYNTDALQERFR